MLWNQSVCSTLLWCVTETSQTQTKQDHQVHIQHQLVLDPMEQWEALHPSLEYQQQEYNQAYIVSSLCDLMLLTERLIWDRWAQPERLILPGWQLQPTWPASKFKDFLIQRSCTQCAYYEKRRRVIKRVIKIEECQACSKVQLTRCERKLIWRLKCWCSAVIQQA